MVETLDVIIVQCYCGATRMDATRRAARQLVVRVKVRATRRDPQGDDACPVYCSGPKYIAIPLARSSSLLF
jgi:hypothetical protein